MSELTIQRSYPLAPAELFAYLTEPGKLAQWWGPEGMAITSAQLDLRTPGPWSMVLETPGGPFEMCGTVISVTPPTSIELTMNVPGQSGPDSTVRFVVDADGTGSRLTLIQSGITDEMVSMGHRGWGSTLDRLARLVGSAVTA